MEYPKIDTLFKREGCGPFDENLKRYVSDLKKKPRISPIIENSFSCEEFERLHCWTVTEKVDGTNIRIIWDTTGGVWNITFRGRHKESMIPVPLLEYLQKTFTVKKMGKCFPTSNVILFGEGYGPKIQKGGGKYREDVSFILFDVNCSCFWLQRIDVETIAEELEIEVVKSLFSPSSLYTDPIWSRHEIVEYVKSKPVSMVAEDASFVMEGIVARSHPLMLFRHNENPIMFKLKCSDFDCV